MKTATPIVSVLMTCFNREKFIGEAIESVLAATFRNLELVIVDDHSTDQTISIARYYAERDARIRVFANTRNIGDYPNRNRAAGFAKGKYIVYTDSDDWMYADALKAWVEIMEKEQAEFGIFNADFDVKHCLLSPRQTISYHFFKKPLLMNGPSATIITKNYFETIYGFPEKYGPANDMYYNLKAASQTNLVVLPFPVNGYRRHEGQEINNRYSYLPNTYLYLRDALEELNLQLSGAEKRYLLSKNKRRFVTNCLSYLKTPRDIKHVVKALRVTRFSIIYFLEALYIRPVKSDQAACH